MKIVIKKNQTKNTIVNFRCDVYSVTGKSCKTRCDSATCDG